MVLRRNCLVGFHMHSSSVEPRPLLSGFEIASFQGLTQLSVACGEDLGMKPGLVVV